MHFSLSILKAAVACNASTVFFEPAACRISSIYTDGWDDKLVRRFEMTVHIPRKDSGTATPRGTRRSHRKCLATRPLGCVFVLCISTKSSVAYLSGAERASSEWSLSGCIRRPYSTATLLSSSLLVFYLFFCLELFPPRSSVQTMQL